MVIKHSTTANPNDIVKSNDWNADHTGTAPPEAHTLASHSTKAHAELTGVTPNQHHTQNADTALGPQTENLDMNTHKIVGVVDPTLDQEAATKKYVDDLIPGVETHYWSCPGSNFTSVSPDTDDVVQYLSGGVAADANAISFVAPVFLPHGAVVTECVVYGNAAAAAESWFLSWSDLDLVSISTMASANINTADNTIADATIDNQNKIYIITTTSLDNGDRIYGARITYTL